MAVVRDADSPREGSVPSERSPHDERAQSSTRLTATTEPAAKWRVLLSSARHELGSPLQSIQGFAELLESEAQGALNAEQHAFVAHILSASAELHAAVDACFGLAEYQLTDVPHTPTLGELRPAVLFAVESLKRNLGISAQLQLSPLPANVRFQVERESLRRMLEVLLIALSAPSSKAFTIALEGSGQTARIAVTRDGGAPVGQPRSVDELARERTITRNTIWFRLADLLSAAQGYTLAVHESLDCAEVRIETSSTH